MVSRQRKSSKPSWWRLPEVLSSFKYLQRCKRFGGTYCYFWPSTKLAWKKVFSCFNLQDIIFSSFQTQHNLSGLVLSTEDVLEIDLIDTTSRLRSGRQRRSLSSWSSASCCRWWENKLNLLPITSRSPYYNKLWYIVL